MKKVLYIILAILIVAIAVTLVTTTNKTFANPSKFSTNNCVTVNSSGVSATGTPSFMTPGTATTTLTCNLSLISGGSDAMDSAALAFQLTATSTGTILNWQYEYSQDGVDWYGDNFSSTTITTSEHSRVKTARLQFASSTDNCAASNNPVTNTRTCRLIDLPTPTKWIRVKFFLPIGSLNGAIYGQIIGKSELIR